MRPLRAAAARHRDWRIYFYAANGRGHNTMRLCPQRFGAHLRPFRTKQLLPFEFSQSLNQARVPRANTEANVAAADAEIEQIPLSILLTLRLSALAQPSASFVLGMVRKWQAVQDRLPPFFTVAGEGIKRYDAEAFDCRYAYARARGYHRDSAGVACYERFFILVADKLTDRAERTHTPTVTRIGQHSVDQSPSIVHFTLPLSSCWTGKITIPSQPIRRRKDRTTDAEMLRWSLEVEAACRPLLAHTAT